jgi:TetR/AcrR family transcriptional regulator, transcriptional repressor for nem operon
MPRPANPETRSRLLERGADLICSRGFNATGLQEITDAAGVPKGSFYNYFDSKETFAVEILSEYWDSLVELYGPILRESDTPPLSRIARYFQGLAEFHERQRFTVGCLIGNLALEVTPSSEEVRSKLAMIYREWSAALAECLREAQASKKLARGKDPKQIAAALIDAFEGAVMRAKVERGRGPFQRFEKCVLPCLLE